MKLTILVAASLVACLPAVAMAQHGHGHGHDHEHEGHGHGHGHGMDPTEGALEHWLPRLEEPERAEWQKPDHVAALLDLEPGMTVADIGAGTGYFLAELSKAVGPDGGVLGLDIAEDLVAFMNERASTNGWTNVHARVISGDDPGLSAEPVDRVLIVNTWHHIGDRSAYSRKLLDGLKPGGAVYVVDFTEDSPHGPPVDHRLSPREVLLEMKAGGLEAELLVAEDLPYQYVVVGRRSARK